MIFVIVFPILLVVLCCCCCLFAVVVFPRRRRKDKKVNHFEEQDAGLFSETISLRDFHAINSFEALLLNDNTDFSEEVLAHESVAEDVAASSSAPVLLPLFANVGNSASENARAEMLSLPETNAGKLETERRPTQFSVVLRQEPEAPACDLESASLQSTPRATMWDLGENAASFALQLDNLTEDPQAETVASHEHPAAVAPQTENGAPQTDNGAPDGHDDAAAAGKVVEAQRPKPLTTKIEDEDEDEARRRSRKPINFLPEEVAEEPELFRRFRRMSKPQTANP